MDKGEQIGSLVINESDRTFEVNVSERGKFKLRIPYPIERTTISAIVSQLLGGAPSGSVPPEDMYRAKVLATLSHVIVEKPKWFEVEKCLDEELLDTLYSRFLEKEAEFRERLKKNQFTRRPEMGKASGTK